MTSGPPGRDGKWPWVRSLRWRLLAGTLVALIVALALAGVLLAELFRGQVMRQFTAMLTAQLDQVTARLEFDAAGAPRLDAQALTDPRWSRPYSGFYWQIDASSARPGVLRSRSLWDATLMAPVDEVADGVVHVHQVVGPEGARLMLVERTIRRGDAAATPWRLLVAADLRETEAAVARFNGVLAASLAALLVLLGAAALAQVAVGLAPLRALQRALAAVHDGSAPRVEGRFPDEVQPLVDDFNRVLDRNAEVVARSRTQAGNLAHAIKTPLAAMAQAASAPAPGRGADADLAGLVREQVDVARRHVDWHLARARAAAAQGLPGARVELAPVIDGLVRVMQHVHAGKELAFDAGPIAADLAFAGEREDLQEMLGNLLDNACQWARRSVSVRVERGAAGLLRIVIDDDGPGIDASGRERVMARGARLDESVPGSGLGLAIVQELAGLYHGEVVLGTAAAGGLRAELHLPAA